MSKSTPRRPSSEGRSQQPSRSETAQRLWVVTEDRQLVQEVERAAKGLDGWSVSGPHRAEELLEAPQSGGLVLVDGQLGGEGPYVSCRRLSLAGGPRTAVVLARLDEVNEPIARFCGARAVLVRGFDRATLAELLDAEGRFAAPAVSAAPAAATLPRALLEELASDRPAPDRRLIEALSDPETSLFNFDFLTFKLDDEFKRARRFGQPLSCVVLGFDGEAQERVLGQLASIFLQAARDTDVLGRFDRSSFLFLLPNTPARGAEAMASRIRSSAAALGLCDVIGERLELAVGIVTYPHAQVTRARDLFHLARETFLGALRSGAGVVLAR